MSGHIRAAQVVLPCPDLDATLRFFTDKLGFKVDLVLPADSPRMAVVSGHGLALRLEAAADGETRSPLTLRLLCDLAALPPGTPRELVAPGGTRVEFADAEQPIDLPEGKQEFVLVRLGGEESWGIGRAGMQYRDLIPGRLGGRFVASQIRIREGGHVPDYVHFHKIRFQMIYCMTGWVRLAYEDQGEPFVLNAGDCVLQPPEIRHRVLESSLGLEVIEIGCPAVHETFADHALALPTPHSRPERRFGHQHFVRHVAASARWIAWRIEGFEACDTGIGAATDGLAGARVVRPVAGRTVKGASEAHGGEFLFLFVLKGALGLESAELGDHRLQAGDCCVIPAGVPYDLSGERGLEMLEVTLPAELPRVGAQRH
jgi:mannose-6-phosphate isomerase-like protein (cupin superfamily)/catechol 2,3-dioxygenase-like lactoylglutathione lyase family enzyme